MTSGTALALEGISVRYGKHIAVDDLTLELEGGQIFGLLGPNGSGKSSTLGAVAGVLDPFSGSIRIQGLCHRASPREYARAVGYVAQNPALYDELSARDNLRFFGGLYGLSGRALRQRIQAALSLVGLAARAGDPLRTFSGGMIRLIHLATALIHEPAVLLLDEPTVALDPSSRDALFATLQLLRDAGRLILLTTHHLDEAEQWCDRVGVLRQGKLVAEGAAGKVLRQNRPEEKMLGTLVDELEEAHAERIRVRLGPEVRFELLGRRMTLKAPDRERMGVALGILYAEGLEIASFRTPPARLDQLACIRDAPDRSATLPFPGDLCRAG